MNRSSTFFKGADTHFGVFYPRHHLLAIFRSRLPSVSHRFPASSDDRETTSATQGAFLRRSAIPVGRIYHEIERVKPN
jgi:hypothetical protein